MALDNTFDRALAMIDHKIQRIGTQMQNLDGQVQALRELRQEILAAKRANNPHDAFEVQRSLVEETPEAILSAPAQSTRKQEVVELLRRNGPLFRREIRERTGMPVGTVAYVLNDKSIFRQVDNGRWDILKKDSAA